MEYFLLYAGREHCFSARMNTCSSLGDGSKAQRNGQRPGTNLHGQKQVRVVAVFCTGPKVVLVIAHG